MLWKQNKKWRISSIFELSSTKSQKNDKLLKRKYEIHHWVIRRNKSIEIKAKHAWKLKGKEQTTCLKISSKLFVGKIKAWKTNLKHHFNHYWRYPITKR
jgi:hypothetical protein